MSVWSETPGLSEFCFANRAGSCGWVDIARRASLRFGVELNADVVRKHVSKGETTPRAARPPATEKRVAKAAKSALGKSAIVTPKGRDFDDPRNFKRFNPLRVAVVDLEATGLNAMYGRLLCGCVLFSDEPEVRVYRGDAFPNWDTRRSDDSPVLRAILHDLEDADVIIAYNGTGYDLPMLRSRALAHSLPVVNPKKIIDPVLKARKELRLPNNKLETVAEFLGVELSKTKIAAEMWVRAGMDGDREAMDYIVEHCIKDVHVLEEVAWRLRKYVRAIDNIGSWR